jgi:Uma2 family endonuclease
MGMPGTARRYTVDEVLAFPDDGNRYELVDGELLVTPSPAQPHQIVLGELYAQLRAYVKRRAHVARAFFAPADIIWGPEEHVQPDLFVVPATEVTDDWRDCRTLLLAVEVVSPSSARADRLTKRRLYQRRGVASYWVVDAVIQGARVPSGGEPGGSQDAGVRRAPSAISAVKPAASCRRTASASRSSASRRRATAPAACGLAAWIS